MVTLRRHTRSIFRVFATLSLAAATVIAADHPLYSAGSAGVPDPTFGTNGSVTTSFDAASKAYAVALQADGKIVAGGEAWGGTEDHGFVFVRYNADGSLDTTFGTGGTVSEIFVNEVTSYQVEAITIQPDGKIIGTGHNGKGVGLARLNADGSLDTSFDSDGLVDGVPAGFASSYAIALQADGKIVVAGVDDGGNLLVARYSTDGSLDAGFDSDGLATTAAVIPTGRAYSVAIQPDNKIVVGGTTSEATPSIADAVVARFNPDGSLDSTFDGDGVVITNLGVAGVHSIAIQDDGKIAAVGYATSGDRDWALIRYNTDGSLDTSFGTTGVVTTGFGAWAEAMGVAVEPSGKIIVTGWVSPSASMYEFLLARYSSGGTLDVSFGTNGVVHTNPSISHARAMVRQPDGRIVVAGNSPGPQFAVARFHTDATNALPVAVADGPYVLTEGTSADGNVLDNDSDGDADPLTAIKVTDPAHGTVTLGADGAFTYTPIPGFVGDDFFTYKANDGFDDSNTASVSLVVSDTPNTAPVAADDGPYVLKEGTSTSGDVLDNDADDDADPLTAIMVTDAAHGTVTLGADGAFTYTPTPGFVGDDSFTYKANDGSVDSDVARVAFVVEKAPVTLGLVDPSTGVWNLRDESGRVHSFYYGKPGDIPFTGDWDCDGIDTPGLFRQSDAFAYLRNANSEGIADIRFFFGNPSDIPIAGDFNGDGCDTLSIYRPTEAKFYIINKLGANNGGLGTADYSFLFGNTGDKPVVGDWDGDGIDEIGLHRESTGLFYWRNTLDTGIADGSIYFGDPDDRFISGDWGQVDEKDTPGVFRPSNSTFYFRHTLTQGTADAQDLWIKGEPGWIPIAGNFGLD